MNAKIPPPNYTQTPNTLLDVWMPKLSGAEFKVLMFISRETFGFHREWTKNKHATQAVIVGKTGLSIGAVKLALTKLMSLDLIESRSTGKVGRGGQGLEYRILVNRQPLTDNDYPIMNDAQQPANGSTIDENGDPLYIHNKESINKKTLEGANDAPGAPDGALPPPLGMHANGNGAYQGAMSSNVPPGLPDLAGTRVPPEPKANGRKPKNPEDRPGPFRDVFRAVCEVRKVNPDILSTADAANTRRLTDTLCRSGVEDAAVVLAWGRDWYADIAERVKVDRSKVTPPSIAQLTTAFGARIAGLAGNSPGKRVNEWGEEW